MPSSTLAGLLRDRSRVIFLMNPNEPASLAGRYFGPLPIAGLAEPLWTCAPVRSCGLSGPLRYRNHPRFNERLPPGCLPRPPLPEVNRWILRRSLPPSLLTVVPKMMLALTWY
jgi:hypothetical protein